jgi:uracil-DNA glycosylase
VITKVQSKSESRASCAGTLPMEFREELGKLDNDVRFAQSPEECQGLPLPGYVGKNYLERRILFVGKNPGQSGKRHRDGYWAGEHHYDRSMSINCLREHYFEGLKRCPVGKFMEELLRNNSLTLRDDIAYTNIVKCATRNNRSPGAPLVRFWLPYLKKELDLLRPKLVVCLGEFTAKKFYANPTSHRTFHCQELIEATGLYLPHPSTRGIKRVDLMMQSSQSFKNALEKVGITSMQP